VLTRHQARISIPILTLIIAALILVGGLPGGVVVRRADAQAQSNPAGLWTLFTDTQDDQTVTQPPPDWNEHFSSQLVTQNYLNITEDGEVDTFRTSQGEFILDYVAYLNGALTCSGDIRISFVFNVTGSVTGQAGTLSASSPSKTQTEGQTNGPSSECSPLYTERAKVFGHVTGLEDLPWADGNTFSNLLDRQALQSEPGGPPAFYQDIQSTTVGLWRLQSYCSMYTGQPGGKYSYLPPVCVGSGNDDQGPISPPVNVNSPNTVILSDGSTIHLGGSALSWNSPGNFTLECPQTCASDSFNLLRGSRGTIVNVNCPSGPCATITATSGANFSLSAASNHVTVNDFDGIVRVGARNSSSAVFLSGALRTYSQKVTVDTNENFTTLQKNATTTYATVPRTCNSGSILLNSGQPISGNLNSIQFCVPAGQVTRLQFSVPPSLQNMTSYYTATCNSSAISMLASGENSTGTTANGIMAPSGIPTEMPIPLISPSGNDPVTIVVNNTGSATALVTFQLQFPFLSVTNPTTTSTTPTTSIPTTSTALTTSSPTASTTSTTSTTSSPTTPTTAPSTGAGGIPEFPYTLFGAAALTATMVVLYLFVRRRRSAP
jgi:hypothetical protein